MIRRPQFERLWGDSSDESKKQLQTHILAADKKAVVKWMREHPSLELAEKPLVDLKTIARRLGITNYSRKGKLELIRDIENKEKRYGSQQGIHA